jgi:hypothetical protein
MMSHIKQFLCTAAISLLSLAPLSVSAAQPPDRGDTSGLGFGNGPSNILAVPNPVAGTGLPIVIITGLGYVWMRRRVRRHKEQNARR